MYFHVMNNYSVDVMHDFLEGVVPFELSLVLHELSTSGHILMDSINQAISFSNYGQADQKRRHPTVSSMHSLRMSTSEMWCFLWNLTLMIGLCISHANKYWKLLLMLLDVADITFAPSLSKGLSDLLICLTDEHHAYFKELLPDKSLLPKHHFLVHYPAYITKSGRPVRYWCIHFEARYLSFKELGKLSHGYKNVCQTFGVRFQLALQLLS